MRIHEQLNNPLRLGVIGTGRIGSFHARHALELARETRSCELVAVADTYGNSAEQTANHLSEQSKPVLGFTTVEDLIQANVVDAAVVASATKDHYHDCRALVDAGYRIMLEKPLAHSVEAASDLCSYLSSDAKKKFAVMQAFMRRFDKPLVRAKRLLKQGRIGMPFKIISILEDPEPLPQGYNSAGILSDMAVHNIDEVTWLLEDRPISVSATCTNLFSHKLSPVEEDFDDAFLQMWFPKGTIGQVQSSRNHVAGYRNETWIFGEEGFIHVGAFQECPTKVSLEAFGRERVLERTRFVMRNYGEQVPVFIERFGPAYKRELRHFVEQCTKNAPFCVDQEDGLLAMKVAQAGRSSAITKDTAYVLHSA